MFSHRSYFRVSKIVKLRCFYHCITGSLPLIRDLQDEGFDVQTSGYGLIATYQAKNEYCLLSDMCQGYKVFVSILGQLED